jgi:DnaJ-class molecular chaperone
MTIGMQVCRTCNGRGFIYRAGGVRRVCPHCDAAQGRDEYERARTKNALEHCWGNYSKSHTGDFNLELAVRACLRADFTLEELARRCHIPMDALRKAAGGQGILSAE